MPKVFVTTTHTDTYPHTQVSGMQMELFQVLPSLEQLHSEHSRLFFKSEKSKYIIVHTQYPPTFSGKLRKKYEDALLYTKDSGCGYSSNYSF